MRPLLLALTLSTVLPVLAHSAGQSLAEVSRKTEAARKAAPGRPPAKVDTNKDLPAVAQLPAPPSTNSSAPAPVAPATAPTKPSSGELPPGANDEAYWRDRMRPLRERLDSARAGRRRQAASRDPHAPGRSLLRSVPSRCG